MLMSHPKKPKKRKTEMQKMCCDLWLRRVIKGLVEVWVEVWVVERPRKSMKMTLRKKNNRMCLVMILSFVFGDHYYLLLFL